MKLKLITPPGLLLTTALLAIYSVYAFMIGSIEDSTPLLVGCALSVAATYGVAMMRPWSRYLVYVLTAGFFAKLGLSLHSGWTSGFYAIQFDSTLEIVVALLPTAGMAALSAMCCWLVYRHFSFAIARA